MAPAPKRLKKKKRVVHVRSAASGGHARRAVFKRAEQRAKLLLRRAAAADAVEHLMRAGVMTGANGTARRTATGAVRRPTTGAGDSDENVRPFPTVRNLSSKPPATAVGRYQSYYSKVCTNERCGHGGDRDARMAATVQYRNVVDILEGKKLSAQHFAPRKLMAVLQNPGDDNHEPYNVARAHYYAIGPKTRSAWRPPLRSQTDKAGVAGWGRRNKSKRR
jgi:hypothetical protein